MPWVRSLQPAHYAVYIPGIYFAVVFSLTFPILIMENSTLSYAFNRSFQLDQKIIGGLLFLYA